jgi:hypothetical protein
MIPSIPINRTPNGTPIPMPTLAPVESPLLGGLEDGVADVGAVDRDEVPVTDAGVAVRDEVLFTEWLMDVVRVVEDKLFVLEDLGMM